MADVLAVDETVTTKAVRPKPQARPAVRRRRPRMFGNHTHSDPVVAKWLAELSGRVAELQRQLTQIGKQMSAELDTLTTEVAETKTVMESAAVLLGRLADLIRENIDSKPQLRALAADLDASQAALAAAVAANTPAEPEPEPEPEPPPA